MALGASGFMVPMYASLSMTASAASSSPALLPGVAVVALILLLPGWVVARAARLNASAALALAPALGCAIAGTAEILAQVVGAPWCPWGWGFIAALTALVAVVARLLAGRGEAVGRRLGASRADRMILGSGLAVAVAVPALVFLTTLPGADYPAQAFDAVFHLSAVATIREGGNASMLGGLADLYGGRAVYYPTVWHGVVALAPGGAVAATNAAVLAVLSLVWPLAAFGMLAQLTGPGTATDIEAGPDGDCLRAVAIAVTVALSAGLVAFALLPMTALAVWPYALSVLGLPGVMVVMEVLRIDTAQSPRRRAVAWLLLVGACGGVMAAHGTGLFNLMVLGLPFAAGALGRLRHLHGRARAWLLGGGAVGVLILAAAAWLLRSSLASVMGYRRPAGGPAGAAGTLLQALADLPMYGSYAGALIPTGAVFGALVIVGAWKGRRDRRLRPWLAAWLLALALVVMVGGPQWAGRQLGSPWYLQKARIAPLVLLPALVLASGAVQALAARLLQQRTAQWRRAGAVALVLLATVPVLTRIPLERALVASIYDPKRIQYGTLVTPDEISLFERATAVLPDDAVVVGAPSLGGAYLWSLGGVHVAYPMRAAPTKNTPQAELLEAWPELDHHTCEVLDELGAEFFFINTDATASGSVTGAAPLRWDAPLAQVPDTGLELVDSEGAAQIWRITGCEGDAPGSDTATSSASRVSSFKRS
ncbi:MULTISPECIES: DUF6541 family protein [unclassified Actinomyces]|uniref:DUF6541 family protein n=1 Tax=unclassified Actinomyces TaxID=2609248 RepID=UPI0011BFAE27|nr:MULTISPECIES: DUF6541 family protein [unclassified Actinomyces]